MDFIGDYQIKVNGVAYVWVAIAIYAADILPNQICYRTSLPTYIPAKYEPTPYALYCYG